MMQASAMKVLVVDDCDVVRVLLHRCLESCGISHVRLAPGAEEALAALLHERFDLVISDYRMGDVDGLEFLQRVRADPATHDLRFIMLTGSDDPEIHGRALALGVSDYITKPVEPRKLREAIGRLFSAAHSDARDCADPRPRPCQDIARYRPGNALAAPAATVLVSGFPSAFSPQRATR